MDLNLITQTTRPNPRILTIDTSEVHATTKEATAFRYAMVVPCYNEENRFPFLEFVAFARANQNVLICFVNDGSTDRTLAVLRGIQAVCPDNICVHSLEENRGKSEAVRQGVLFVREKYQPRFIGFLDADLATLPGEWLEMARHKERRPQFGAIVGSRIQRLGANIQRDDDRSFFSNIVKRAIRFLLKTPFQDSQCGAKVFEESLVPALFQDPFVTPWLFDVEIFLRLQRKFGNSTLQKGVLEFPLMHWAEVGDSKLKFKHAVRIPWHIVRLFLIYR